METTRSALVENYRIKTLQSPAKLEDEASVNTPFLHTFTGLPRHPTGITVELGLRAVGEACANDVVGFQLIANDNPEGTDTWQWLWFIDSYTEQPWIAGTERVIRYDLGDLPDGHGGRISLLDSITRGTLDVVVNDDTAVDYVKVTVRS